MKKIDNSLLDSLTQQARASARKRAHYNLHTDLSDPVQRLCIAMEPGTYVRPHRHSDPETWEVLLIVRGSVALDLFDEKGMLLQRTVLDAEGSLTAVELPSNTWHAPTPLESGTIVFEIKRGPYKPIPEAHCAAWAPGEGEAGTQKFIDWFRNAAPGSLPPRRGQ